MDTTILAFLVTCLFCLSRESQYSALAVDPEENSVDKSIPLEGEDSLSLGKWNIVSNMILMLSKDIHVLKAQLEDLKKQGHVTQKTLKSLKASCRNKQASRKPTCPADFTLSKGGSCYQVATELVSWQEASDRCQQLGAHLVSIDTKSEQRYLVNNIRKLPAYQHCSIWAGATARQPDRKWRWVSSGKEILYANWMRGEPNSGQAGEECLLLDWMFNWQWNDVRCDVIKSCFICEYDASKNETETNETDE